MTPLLTTFYLFVVFPPLSTLPIPSPTPCPQCPIRCYHYNSFYDAPSNNAMGVMAGCVIAGPLVVSGSKLHHLPKASPLGEN